MIYIFKFLTKILRCSFSIDPTRKQTTFSNLIARLVHWLSIYAVNQVQVQRYLSVPSARDAKW